MKDFKIEIVITFRNIYRVLPNQFLSYVADPPRGFASYLEKVMKRQWGSRRDTYRFTTYQDARRVRLVDGLFETNVLRVSPVSLIFETNILRVSSVKCFNNLQLFAY